MIYDQKPDAELIKELYARFGLAYYHSECLHRELSNIYVLGTFEKSADITRPRLEEKLAFAYSLSLGDHERGERSTTRDSILRTERCYKKEELPCPSFLVWTCVSHVQCDRRKQYDRRVERLFSTVQCSRQESLSIFWAPKKELGLTDEIVHAVLDKAKPMEPLPQKRPFKKQERLVRVWEFPLRPKIKPLIFETEDRCFWQLCDVGLGWTDFETIGPDWQVNKEIQKYLPANINPRPKISKPWDYEFKLAKDAIFWVKPGKLDRSFQWGIKVRNLTKSE